MEMDAIQKLNRELAEKINEEALRDPQSPHRGKFAGFANGHLVVVADTLDEVGRCLREAEPDGRRCFGLELGRDYGEVHYVWGAP